MKAKYKFPIEGQIKFDPRQMLPIKSESFIFEFVIDSSNVATHIEVTVPVSEQNYPKLITIKDKHHQLKMNNPALGFIQRHLKGIESLMSIWGLKSIDRKSYDIKWIPENQLERDQLKINNVSVKSEKMSIAEKPPVSFDLAARAIINSWDGANISVVCGFYSKGSSDIGNHQYIDAIYDFYLILETCFCDGKWRNTEVKNRLKSSLSVQNAFNKMTEELPLTREQSDKLASRAEFHDFESFINHIVDVRGHLHHHSEKNPRVWDPNRPEEFDLEAIYLQLICFDIIFNKIEEYTYKPSIIENYNNQCSQYNNKRPNTP